MFQVFKVQQYLAMEFCQNFDEKSLNRLEALGRRHIFFLNGPTRLNLNRRNIQVLDQSCPVCKDAAEEVSHLFFSCPLAVDVHRLICRWWNLTWSPLSSYEEWLSWFKDIRLGSILKCMLEGIFYVSWWSIWNYRNSVLFAAQPPRKDIIFDDIVTRSFLWCHARCNKAFSWDRWLQHPYLLSL
ncbi:RNA-directed DNA polymerase, eukaryota [Tanacetum coccineum]